MSVLDVFRLDRWRRRHSAFARHEALDESIGPRFATGSLFGATAFDLQMVQGQSRRWRSTWTRAALLVYRAAWTQGSGRPARDPRGAMAKLYATDRRPGGVDRQGRPASRRRRRGARATSVERPPNREFARLRASMRAPQDVQKGGPSRARPWEPHNKAWFRSAHVDTSQRDNPPAFRPVARDKSGWLRLSRPTRNCAGEIVPPHGSERGFGDRNRRWIGNGRRRTYKGTGRLDEPHRPPRSSRITGVKPGHASLIRSANNPAMVGAWLAATKRRCRGRQHHAHAARRRNLPRSSTRRR